MPSCTSHGRIRARKASSSGCRLLFTYAGLHREALVLREQWFRKPQFPNHVIWWVADNHVPTFVESTAKLELLHAEGPTPQAFNFRRAFDSRGVAAVLDRALAKESAARNANAG